MHMLTLLTNLTLPKGYINFIGNMLDMLVNVVNTKR